MAGSDKGKRKSKRAKDGAADSVEAIFNEAKAKQPQAATSMLELDRVRPNPWNPNKLDPLGFRKLKHGIKELVEKGQTPPPIIVRPTKGDLVDFEVIDGEHRYRAFSEIFKETQDDRFWQIPVWVLDVDTPTAKTLTLTLNYLRGESKDEDYTRVIEGILKDSAGGITIDDLASWLPQDSNTIQAMLREYAGDFDFEALIADFLPVEDDELDRSNELDISHRTQRDAFTVLNIRVPSDVGGVFADEMTRLKEYFRSQGVGEAGLETMAFEALVLNSATTPLDQVQGVSSARPKKRALTFDDSDFE